jgi:DNA (cytosine-5)-methyltransferase 1
VISPREAAKLHSFPDWFRVHATKWHAFRQIGNSLPPLLARTIASEIVKAIGAKPSRPGRSLQLGDVNLVWLDTRSAATHFDVSIDLVPSHKRRLRKKRAPEPVREDAA